MPKPKPEPNQHARFTLSGPRDLLAKLRYDLGRLQDAEQSAAGQKVIYSAIDCAVDIASLRDWIFEWCDEQGRDRPDFRQMPDFRIALEMANGAKHYAVRKDPLPYFVTGAVFITVPGAASQSPCLIGCGLG